MAYKSITLAPGEIYVLPAGATVLSVSNPNIYSSEKGCAPLDNLETLTCYKFRFSGALSDGGRTENWDEENYRVDGITVNNVYYPFSSSFSGWQNTSSWETALNSIAQFSGIFSNINSTLGYDTGGTFAPGSGFTNLVRLSTLPSIAENMFFNISTIVQNQDPPISGGTSTYAYVKGELCNPSNPNSTN